MKCIQYLFTLFFLLIPRIDVESKLMYQGRRYGNELHFKQNTNNNEIDGGPPPPAEAARMARYIVHNADWSSVATISSMTKITSFPFANIFSVSDGMIDNNSSTGIPYLYMTPIDMTAQDIERDSRCSLTMTLAQGDYCKNQNLDPEDPRCAHVILTGRIKKLAPGTLECNFAKEALFSRHPIMKTWPKDHDWYFAKLNIEQVCVMDYFGGPKFVPVDDYFLANPEEQSLINVIVV